MQARGKEDTSIIKKSSAQLSNVVLEKVKAGNKVEKIRVKIFFTLTGKDKRKIVYVLVFEHVTHEYEESASLSINML